MKMTPPYWEHFDHEADMGIRGIGITLDQAFEQAALALTALLTDPRHITPAMPVHITCRAPTREQLLVDWLNSLIYEMATRHMLFSHFRVTIRDQELTAVTRGDRLARVSDAPALEVKAATYAELKVFQENGRRWIAQCVVDV